MTTGASKPYNTAVYYSYQLTEVLDTYEFLITNSLTVIREVTL